MQVPLGSQRGRFRLAKETRVLIAVDDLEERLQRRDLWLRVVGAPPPSPAPPEHAPAVKRPHVGGFGDRPLDLPRRVPPIGTGLHDLHLSITQAAFEIDLVAQVNGRATALQEQGDGLLQDGGVRSVCVA